MQLADYLREHSLSYSEFARRIGTRHARTVERHAKGMQIPNATMMRGIAQATNGLVTPNDFFDVLDGSKAAESVLTPAPTEAAAAHD